MSTLTFQATEIRPLVQHAFDCKLHRPGGDIEMDGRAHRDIPGDREI